MRSLLLFLCALTVSAHAEAPASAPLPSKVAPAPWYNEPDYIDPGKEGLQPGLTPLAYRETAGNAFLGQTVCVDAADRPLPTDPFDCPASRRKLRVGEDLPYLRVSQTSAGKLAGVSNSIPLAFEDRVRFLNTRHSGSIKHLLRNYSTGDGYDVTDNYLGYSFIYGTRDPQTTAEDYIWCGELGALGQGWVLWPDGIEGRGSQVFKIAGGHHGACRPTNRTYTVWEAPKSTVFTNGRTLLNIKTLHFSGASVAASQELEVFYQNPVYGAIRWEAWKTTPQNDGGKNSGGSECNGSPTMEVDGKTFYRKYCHEWTRVLPLTTPYHAYHNPLNPVFTSSPQLLKNADFVEGNRSWAFEWFGAGAIEHSVVTEDSGNPYLSMEKKGLGVASVVQAVDVPMASQYAKPVLQGGALLKGPAGAQGVIGVVLRTHGGPPQELKLRFTFKNNDWTVLRFHAESARLADPDVKLSFKFYPKDAGRYAMDEAFLAVLPKSLP